MIVRMLTGIAGARYAAGAGELIEVDEADGKRLIEAGLAEKAKREKGARLQRAVLPEPETPEGMIVRGDRGDPALKSSRETRTAEAAEDDS